MRWPSHLGLTDAQKGLVAKARCASQLKLESSLGDEGDLVFGPSSTRETAWRTRSRCDERAEVLSGLDRLDDRERLILSLRFGLAGEPPQTLKEIGRRLGVTREWVRKIELRAMSKLVAATVPCYVPPPLHDQAALAAAPGDRSRPRPWPAPAPRAELLFFSPTLSEPRHDRVSAPRLGSWPFDRDQRHPFQVDDRLAAFGRHHRRDPVTGLVLDLLGPLTWTSVLSPSTKRNGWNGRAAAGRRELRMSWQPR